MDSTVVLETIRAHRHPQDERWSLAALKTLSFLSQSNQDEVLEASGGAGVSSIQVRWMVKEYEMVMVLLWSQATGTFSVTV